MIFIYELIYKLCTFNEDILSKLFNKDIIILLIGKLENEMKKIRLVIYDTVTYLIKQKIHYNRTLFDLEIDEKEGTIDFRETMSLKQINDKIINVLFEERNDLLMILLTILVYDDNEFTRNFYFEILIKLYDKYCDNEEKMSDIIDILLTLVKVNDKYTFERLYNILGFPNIIIKQIPRNKDSDDDNNDDDKENKNDNSQNQKQNWPLFGAKLIDRDIDRQIYEYICMNIRDNSFCLLKLLFPNEDIEDKKEEDNKKKVKLSNEDKKNIILELFNNCFRRNNYSLFKYIYLNPAPSLRHRNLYEKMKEFVQEEDKAVNMEIFEEKEERFITNIKREINNDIDKIKNPEKNRYNERNYYEEDEDLILPGLEEFNIYDKKLKNFIGFNSDIIPGDIVREEIIQITKVNNMAIYRVEYYTKYHKTEELRNFLLRKKKEDKKENEVKKEENENKKNENKVEEKRKEDKGENEEKKEEKNDEDKKDDNKEDGKKEENKGEDRDKKDEGKKDLENENNEEGENKENEKDKATGENNEDKNSSSSKEENKEEKEEMPEITETEIDDSRGNLDKYDISEKNENSFIYSVFSNDTILEDKSLKDKNKVKNTLYRFIFVNKDPQEKSYRAHFKYSEKIKNKPVLNFFIPTAIFSKIGSDDISNFYNVMRIKGDLPFLKRDDVIVSIGLSNDFNIKDIK